MNLSPVGTAEQQVPPLGLKPSVGMTKLEILIAARLKARPFTEQLGGAKPRPKATSVLIF